MQLKIAICLALNPTFDNVSLSLLFVIGLIFYLFFLFCFVLLLVLDIFYSYFIYFFFLFVQDDLKALSFVDEQKVPNEKRILSGDLMPDESILDSSFKSSCSTECKENSGFYSNKNQESKPKSWFW